MFVRILSWLAIACMLSGCLNVPRQSFNKAANPHIKTIAVLPVPVPKEHFVNILHHPGLNFGLIGGLVAAAELQSKTDQFTAAVKQNKDFNLAQDFVKSLQSDTTGLTFQLASVDLPADRTDFLSDYSGVKVEADAYLDIVVRSAGYTAQYPSTPYIPSIYAPVRLVDAKTKEVLYSTLIQYGDANPILEVSHIQPADSFRYSNFESLINNQAQAASGLKEGAEKIGQRIVSELK